MGLAAIGLALGAVGTVASMSAQRRAAGAGRQQQAVQARASRRQAIRQGMQARAQALATAQATGTAGGSGAIGGIGAISSQLGSSIGTQAQLTALSGIISTQQARAATFGSIANLGFTGASLFGGIKLGGTDTSGPTVPDFTQPTNILFP